MNIRSAAIVAAVTGVTAGLVPHGAPRVQASVYFVPEDRLTVRRMSEVPPVDVAPGVHVRTVVGTTGSFSVGEFEPGAATAVHHHTREQANIAISGEFAMTLGKRVEKLSAGLGVIVPPNLPHSVANKGTARATLIEFHTVRRPDLVPPRPAIAFPMGDTPATVPAGRQLLQPMDRPIGESSSSAFWQRGETCLLAWRHLAAGTARVELRVGSVERFLYVVRGRLELTSPSGAEQVAAGSLVVVPAGATITIQAAGREMAAVAEFIPSASER